MVYAVLLSGGVGSRTGFDIPKQFIKFNNKPMLVFCIEKFISISDFKKIIVSSPKEFLIDTNKLITKFFPNERRIVVIEGGLTRQDTLMNSINYVVNKLNVNHACIICHDAARIFVSKDQIELCIKYTKKYGAASPVIPSTDVIVETRGDVVFKMPNRYNMVHVQTPQGFFADEYLELFDKISSDNIDSVHEVLRVYFLNNKNVFLFDGEKSNFKITTSIDVEIAKNILKE